MVHVASMPETRFASVGDADVAYQVFGGGPIDFVYFFGLGSHIELEWETPADAEFLRGLGRIGRVAVFDRRGTGLSDGVLRSGLPTWEDWTRDLQAVLDAVGWGSAAIVAELDAGPIAILFATTHPERVNRLVLSNTTARYRVADDYPTGVPDEDADATLEVVRALWGTTDLVRLTAPGLNDDEASLRAFARAMRASATPRTAEAQYRYAMSVDVRDMLPLIQAPTLVIHNKGNPFVPVEHGEYLAEHIAGAKLVTIEGVGAAGTPVADAFLDAVSEFLTGQRTTVDADRVLATVMFTDIVESTVTATRMGDSRWRHVLDVHDQLIREQLPRFGGREVNTTGDGFVATFDGPARGVRCGQALIHALGQRGIQVRVGLHTGECELRGDDLAGLTVHIAARVAALAGPNQLLVTSTLRDLVLGSGIDFEEAGAHSLKGVPGTWTLLAAKS
jgi:class 3 adenylate cyclase/alpha-beta hydrolase superfamily lysophospholipase